MQSRALYVLKRPRQGVPNSAEVPDTSLSHDLLRSRHFHGAEVAGPSLHFRPLPRLAQRSEHPWICPLGPHLPIPAHIHVVPVLQSLRQVVLFWQKALPGSLANLGHHASDLRFPPLQCREWVQPHHARIRGPHWRLEFARNEASVLWFHCLRVASVVLSCGCRYTQQHGEVRARSGQEVQIQEERSGVRNLQHPEFREDQGMPLGP
mmetsp:Transcript_45029/g.119402  ORF Transcript_45029/g.119402 Transcript_45029/m.119402 type:complete len:207 (-) Transcript_45029:450-1070(-)